MGQQWLRGPGPGAGAAKELKEDVGGRKKGLLFPAQLYAIVMSKPRSPTCDQHVAPFSTLRYSGIIPQNEPMHPLLKHSSGMKMWKRSGGPPNPSRNRSNQWLEECIWVSMPIFDNKICDSNRIRTAGF